MNNRITRIKFYRWIKAPVMRMTIITLLVAATSAWIATQVWSQDEPPPAPTAQSTINAGNTIYLPLVQNAGVVQASQLMQRDVPELGLIYTGLEADVSGFCRGLWRVKGTNYCTHGPDRPPPGLEVKQDAALPLAKQQATEVTASVCDGNGTSGNRVQVMYVRASDKADRYNQFLASIRQWAADADEIYYQSAVETGGTRRIRFVHDASCVISVANVVLSASGDDSFSNTISGVQAQGYNRSDRKYMMFVDANIYCGIGGLYGDDSSSQSNSNNIGPSYGRTDSGCWGGHTAAHELGHNLGAVQLSAPYTSAGYHCVDEYDVMCYSDSPNYPPMQYLCADSAHENRMDCNHNDYYHTSPPANSYLATHWNMANNQFLINANLPTPTRTPTPTSTATPLPGCTIYHSNDVPKTINDNATVDSTLSVPNNITLNDVNLHNLQIAHTYDGDLQAILISPAGTQVQLFSSVGGSGDNFTSTVLDDAATTSITSGTASFNGRYRPSGTLSAFNGQSSSGTWRLRISDVATTDTGSLNAWSLELCGSSGTTPTPTPTSTPTPSVDAIFADGFETGNLSRWDQNSIDGGDLSVTAAAKLVGAYGLQATIDDNNSIYVRDNHSAGEARYRVRFKFDPNSIPMASNNAHYIFYGYGLSGSSDVAVLRVELRKASAGYQLRAALLNDSTSWKSSNWFTISDAPHSVELDWKASTTTSAKNGSLVFWIDGAQKANLTGVDNDTRRVHHIRLGALAAIDSGTRGTYYFDAFESRRQTYIGPAASTGLEEAAPLVEVEVEAAAAPEVSQQPTIVIAASVMPGAEATLTGEGQGVGLTLLVPANAAPGPLSVVVTQVADDILPDGYELLGGTFSLELHDANGMPATLAQPLTLLVHYADAGDLAPADVSLQVWNAASDVWELVPSSVDTAEGSLRAELSQSATLAVFQREATGGASYLPVVER